jgi:Electron transfer DM13
VLSLRARTSLNVKAVVHVLSLCSLWVFRRGRCQMKKWRVAVAVLVVVLFAAWYAFRPEGLFIDRRVQEELPAVKGGARLEPLASGSFYGVVHPTQGTATIYQVGEGSRLLRFTNFRTTNGPNVHVYMVAADDAKDNASVQRAGFIDLGPLKGNVGDQNYALGPGVDLSKYRAVSVWCQRFSLNFGTAPLTTDRMTSRK